MIAQFHITQLFPEVTVLSVSSNLQLPKDSRRSFAWAHLVDSFPWT